MEEGEFSEAEKWRRREECLRPGNNIEEGRSSQAR